MSRNACCPMGEVRASRESARPAPPGGHSVRAYVACCWVEACGSMRKSVWVGGWVGWKGIWLESCVP